MIAGKRTGGIPNDWGSNGRLRGWLAKRGRKGFARKAEGESLVSAKGNRHGRGKRMEMGMGTGVEVRVRRRGDPRSDPRGREGRGSRPMGPVNTMGGGI